MESHDDNHITTSADNFTFISVIFFYFFKYSMSLSFIFLPPHHLLFIAISDHLEGETSVFIFFFLYIVVHIPFTPLLLFYVTCRPKCDISSVYMTLVIFSTFPPHCSLLSFPFLPVSFPLFPPHCSLRFLSFLLFSPTPCFLSSLFFSSLPTILSNCWYPLLLHLFLPFLSRICHIMRNSHFLHLRTS